MTSLFRMIEKLLMIVTSSLMVTLLVTLSWQVFSRYILSQPSTITEELSRLLLICMGSLGASLTFLQKKQLALELLRDSASPKMKTFMDEGKNSAIMILGLILIIGGVMMISEKWNLGQTTPVLGIKLVYLYFLLPLSGIIIFLSPFYQPEDSSCK